MYYVNTKPLKGRRIQLTIPKMSNSLKLTDSTSSPCHHLFRNATPAWLHYSWHHSSVLSLTESEHSSEQISLAHFQRYGKIYVFISSLQRWIFLTDKYFFNPSIHWNKYAHIKSILLSHIFTLSSLYMAKSQTKTSLPKTPQKSRKKK